MTLATKVKKANVEYHAKMAGAYDKTQPYFTQDNITRVEKIISEIGERTGGKGTALDIGCGTGFVMRIAERHFSKVYGVDITKEMLDQIPASKKLFPVLADSENLPFGDNTFDACFSYSFLHHLYDLKPTLKEIRRVLKPGGTYFNDQDFNRAYFALSRDKAVKNNPKISAEFRTLDAVEKEVAAKYGLDPKTVRLAEFQEMKKGGFTAKELEKQLKASGFRKIDVRHRWFVGQARVQNECGMKAAEEINAYLLNLMPLTSGFFKYLSFKAVK
ncbi:hypothetical protein AUJ65_00175 [Candidatus Micrarchaeota archaeon CG1_02_51_15]|nr:MAG: hypothetical protein AUJ65_00175 [Candidatus Micrarchaeota archaeon CG1_02_51_15]